MWRPARAGDDDAVAAMCAALYREDPSPDPVGADHIRRTLAALRAEPARGRAVVLDLGGPAGYALLAAFWSNELGGEICIVDEMYVAAAHRSRGHATDLVARIAAGELWPTPPVAIDLEVSPANARARALYARLGFRPIRNALLRRR
jgi:GNAT superfamily N-acetyltransferase